MEHRPGTGAARRVAVIAYHSSPLHEPGTGDAGGMTVYVRQLADAMARRGVATDIFTRATSPEDRIVRIGPLVRILPITAGPVAAIEKNRLPELIPDFVAGVRLASLAQRVRYDVIHSHYWQSGLAGRELATGWDVPLVHSNHTLGRVKNGTLVPGEPPESSVRIAGEEQVISAADALIASTEDEYAHLTSLYGAPNDRLKILPPGVDHEAFHPRDRVAARRELGLEEGPIILYVGRIQPLKGLELALRGLEQLVHALETPPLLLLVGGPSGSQGEAELERLGSLAAELGLQDRVRFQGPQPHARLPLFYAASDVVVVSSYTESFGFAALEAHACARPVVGTPVGGLSHVVASGTSGFLVPERDPTRFAAALKTLLSDDVLALSFGEAAARAADGFTWNGTASALLDLYDCLVREHRPELCVC